MNENDNNEVVESAGYTTIGARRTITTKSGNVRTDSDKSVLPRVRRYRIDAGRSGVSCGEWKTNYLVYLKVEGREDRKDQRREWLNAATLGTEYGVSVPVSYKTFEKAKDAAKRMLKTWGYAKEEKKATVTKKDLLAMTPEQFVAWQAEQRKAK